MSNTTNVTTILDHTGTLWAYAARTDKLLRYSRTVGGDKSSGTINVGDANVTSQAGMGVALTPPTTNHPAGQRVLFWVNDDKQLVCMVDGSGKGYAVGLGAPKDYNNIGVATLAAGAVTATFDGSAIVVAVWGWDGLTGGKPSATVAKSYSASKLGLGSANAFSGTSSHNGSSIALASFLDASGATRLLMVSTWARSDGKVHVVAHVLDVATETDDDTIVATGISCSSPILDRTASGQADCPSAFQRPDGRLMVWFVDGNGVEQSLVTPTSGDDWYGDWQNVNGRGDIPALGKYSYPTAIAFLPRSPSTQRSPVANALTNATVDVYDAAFGQDGDDITAAIDNNKWGTLRRTAQAPQPQQQTLALGVIYGPPPVPLENINMPSEYSNASTSGVVSFSQKVGTTSGMSANLGGSIFGKIGASVGNEEKLEVLGFEIAGYSVKAQVELSLGASLMGAWSSDVTQSVTTTVQATVSLAGHAGSSSTDPNDYTVQQTGQILGLSSSWASYVYDFVDANGNSPSNALSFAVVFPYQPTLVLTPFTIPSTAAGPHPGDLTSYQLTNSQLNDLDSRAHPVGGRSFIQVAWSAGGLSASVAETYDQSAWSVNLGLDLGLLLGAEGSGNVLGFSVGGNVSVDLKASFGYAWTGGGQTSAQFSSSVEVPGNTTARGTYSAYGYRAYLLNESKQNLSLVPAGVSGISADSKPWLITYAVTSTTKV